MSETQVRVIEAVFLLHMCILLFILVEHVQHYANFLLYEAAFTFSLNTAICCFPIFLIILLLLYIIYIIYYILVICNKVITLNFSGKPRL